MFEVACDSHMPAREEGEVIPGSQLRKSSEVHSVDSVRKVGVKLNVASLQGHFLITWEGARVSYTRTGKRRQSTCPAAVIWAGPTHPWMRSWPELQPGKGTVRTDRWTWGSRACGSPTLLMPQASQGPPLDSHSPLTVSLPSHRCHPWGDLSARWTTR